MRLAQVQRHSFANATKRINIWHGPVRSGKSIASIVRWLDYINRDAPPGDLYMFGRTVHALKRNILQPMEEMVGQDMHYSAGKGEIKLWSRTIHVIGANDERAEGKIRGSTSAGSYADEVSLYPESFFRMALSRMSVPGAKMLGTTNPDAPTHWLKTDFIDRAEEMNAAVFHWGLHDIDFLPAEFIEALEREFTGLWRKRFIEGLWVVAEGAIYDMFKDEIHIFDEAPDRPDEYIIGVDYGTGSPTVFILIGVRHMAQSRPIAWAESEYYYDPAKHYRQKTDVEYAGDLIGFMHSRQVKRKSISAIYVDPSAASFKLECERQGIYQIKDADNDVLNGIRTVSSMLHTGRYSVHRSCTHTIRENSSYVWDPKKTRRGVDEPVKSDDHAKDAERYALHSHFGNQSILYTAASMRS